MVCLVGAEAPDFCAKAVIEQTVVDRYQLSDLSGKYIVFFFYPLDFTFVCPTELLAFQQRLYEFRERNCEVVACSTDSHYSHLAWLRTPREKGGIEGVQYAIVSDIHKSIASDYGVLCCREGVAYRGLFLIDRQGIIRHQVINDLPLGRSVDEVLRMLDALRFHESHGEVCPANWQQGQSGFQASQDELEKYVSAEIEFGH
jgi:peroxiredoxin 2/4